MLALKTATLFQGISKYFDSHIDWEGRVSLHNTIGRCNRETSLADPREKFIVRRIGLGRPFSIKQPEEHFLTELVTDLWSQLFKRSYRRSVTPFRNAILAIGTNALDEIPSKSKAHARELRIIRSDFHTDEGRVDLNDLRGFLNLFSLSLGAFVEVRNVSALSALRSLRRFSSEDDLDQPIPFSDMKHLQEVCVSGRKHIANISDARQLEYISIDKIGPQVPSLGKLPKLKRLDLVQCRRLTDLSLVAGSKSVEVLDIYGGQQLTRLDAGDGGLDRLQDITIESCHKLESLNGIEGCKNLRRVHVTNCKRLRDLSVLTTLEGKIDVIFVKCPKIGKNTQQRLINASNINHYYFN